MGAVVVGVAQVVQREPGALDATGLMVQAARLAADDAGAPGLLERVEAVLVPEGTWAPAGDAGRAVAAAVGAPSARSVLARIGVLQTTLVARAAQHPIALIVGGEARASERAGAPTPPLPPGSPDEELVATADIVTAVEIERGLAVPVQSYALQESALGTTEPELDALWAGFAAVARTNPHAWDPSPVGGDRLVSTPYRRRHCSQWNVDMAVALLVCDERVAAAAGVERDRWVRPLAVIESNAMIPVTGRAELDRSPAVAVVGRRLAERTGIEPAAVDHLDLYSCFPSAVRIQANELGIDAGRSLTVTGGMALAGGPLNSAALHAMASMVEVLRADPGSLGLVTAVSGMLTKHGASLWSTEAGRGNGGGGALVVDDVADEAMAATAVVEIDPGFRGEAVVEGATIVHDRNGPALAVVAARTPEGRRAVATGPPEVAPVVGAPVRLDGGAATPTR